jgi:uncharacterized membrane protein
MEKSNGDWSEGLIVSTWHHVHRESLSLGQRLADALARFIGSWTFIIFQTVLVAAWAILSITAYVQRWDPYPFILLNLLFSTQAAYAAPIIMMSQNRQNELDRVHALTDLKTDERTERKINELRATIATLETEKIDKILEILKTK